MNNYEKFFNTGRGTGKTQLLIDAMEQQKEGIIVAADSRQVRDIRQRLKNRNIAVVSVDSFRPEGLHVPILFDHYAYELALTNLYNDLAFEKKRRAGAEEKLHTLRSRIRELVW